MTVKTMRRALFAVIVGFGALVSAQAQTATVVSVTGYIYDELTREPVDGVRVKFLHENANPNISESHNGGYYLVTALKPGEVYRVRIERANYFQAEYEFRAPNTDKYAEISRDFLVKPLRKDVKLPLPVSPFDLKKSKLRVGAGDILEDLAQLLRLNPGVKVEIRCFPDENKDADANLRLTTQRCEAIREYLQKQGISASRVSVKPNAGIDPLNPLPLRKRAKGKRYIGETYIVVKSV